MTLLIFDVVFSIDKTAFYSSFVRYLFDKDTRNDIMINCSETSSRS
jgi:hypothetical protein